MIMQDPKIPIENNIIPRELELDTKIYRYIKVDRLFEMIMNKKLVLVNPRKWDDTFESILSMVTI